MTYTVREECKPSNLDGISDRQIEEHWGLYKGYVAQSNTLKKELDDMRTAGQGASAAYADRRRRFAFEYAGMVMHEYYFANLKEGVCHTEAPTFMEKIVARYGDFNAWLEDFKNTGLTRGIGWAVCLIDPLTGDINNHFVQEHAEGMLAGYHPLLMMDVWEHAYLFDVGALERGKHIDAFLNNINWNVVEERTQNATKGQLSQRFAA